MAVDGVMAKLAVAKVQAQPPGHSFKDVMQKKRENVATNPTPHLSLKNAVNDMIQNHETATKVIKTFMTKTDYSPQKLLKIQYKTGMLFLREQMYCKTAELSANTFKNLTQMQI